MKLNNFDLVYVKAKVVSTLIDEKDSVYRLEIGESRIWIPEEELDFKQATDIDWLKNKVESLEKENEALKSKIQEMEEKNSSLEKELSDAIIRHINLFSKNAELFMEIDNLKEKIVELEYYKKKWLKTEEVLQEKVTELLRGIVKND